MYPPHPLAKKLKVEREVGEQKKVSFKLSQGKRTGTGNNSTTFIDCWTKSNSQKSSREQVRR